MARFANALAIARFKYNSIQTYMMTPNNTLQKMTKSNDKKTEIRKIFLKRKKVTRRIPMTLGIG